MANVKITEEEFNSLLKQLEEHATSNGFMLNPDQNVVKSVIAGLIKNRQLYGDYYCPCRLRKDMQYVCPCASHKRDIQKQGKCTCNLFVRKEEKNAEESSQSEQS